MKLNNISKVKILKLKKITSKGASLYIFQNINNLFEIKRIFSVKINKFNNNIRGGHAHKIDHQIITCQNGSINFYVDDGLKRKKFKINNQLKAIYVPKHIWTETEYLSENTIVTVYSSTKYTEKSYIREYDSFLKFKKL